MNWVSAGKARQLVYDLENKPGTYGGGDYTFPKVTALAARFLDEKKMHVWCLDRRDPRQMKRAAREFLELWETSDVVIGHNIRRHDAKLLPGLYTALDMPLLPVRRMRDTYSDQPKMSGISRSLENLGSRWGCPVAKVSMSEWDWERAYDGIPAGVAKMRKRVTTDVEMTIWLYRELLRRKLL